MLQLFSAFKFSYLTTNTSDLIWTGICNRKCYNFRLFLSQSKLFWKGRVFEENLKDEIFMSNVLSRGYDLKH